MPIYDTDLPGNMPDCRTVELILAPCDRYIWEEYEYLRKNFGSTESILAEMSTIRCIEHTGRMKFVTPFVGAQVKICEAFDIQIPDCCSPVHISKAKQITCYRGRSAKPQGRETDFLAQKNEKLRKVKINVCCCAK